MSPRTDEEQVMWEVGLAAFALLDTLMTEGNPTGVGIEDPAERVQHVCRIYGEWIKPEWKQLRARLGERKVP